MAHDQRLMVKLTSDEKQQLEQIARREGLNLSAAVRALVHRASRELDAAEATTAR
jgi:antitoxin component of RelBE/YafQ-DinJ toxin-antitoxin module